MNEEQGNGMNDRIAESVNVSNCGEKNTPGIKVTETPLEDVLFCGKERAKNRDRNIL
jgi:hypothetical protein